MYEQIVAESRDAITSAVTTVDGVEEAIRAGLTAWWDTITSDVRRARIMTLEIVGVSEAIEARRREVRHSFADFVAALATESRLDRATPAPNRSGHRRARACRTIVDLVVDLTRGDTDSSTATMIEICFQLVSLAFDASFEPRPRRRSSAQPPSSPRPSA